MRFPSASASARTTHEVAAKLPDPATWLASILGPSPKLCNLNAPARAQGRRPWKTSTQLKDLIDLPPSVAHILRPWQPTLVYHLLELVRIPYDAFAGTPEGILTLRALKAEPMNKLLEDVIWDESLLFSISEGALERILRYIINTEV
ncbi:MAG: hypothetical protein ORN83_02840, partial [Chthoniobacteraceae bacterium]|nr:hypothetical protein [Chthoniobacteraceae bacterium]